MNPILKLLDKEVARLNEELRADRIRLTEQGNLLDHTTRRIVENRATLEEIARHVRLIEAQEEQRAS